MYNYYAGYWVAPNGDVSIDVTSDEGYGCIAIIPFTEFAKIAEESANAERGNTDLPVMRGMV